MQLVDHVVGHGTPSCPARPAARLATRPEHADRRRAGGPEPPRQLGGQADPDPRAGRDRRRRPGPRCSRTADAGVEQVGALVVGADRQRLGQPGRTARPGRGPPGPPDAAPAASSSPTTTSPARSSTAEPTPGGPDDDVRAPVHAVAEVDVEPPGRAEHDLRARRRPAVRVRRRVHARARSTPRPRSAGRRPALRPVGDQPAAEQRRRDRDVRRSARAGSAGRQQRARSAVRARPPPARTTPSRRARWPAPSATSAARPPARAPSRRGPCARPAHPAPTAPTRTSGVSRSSMPASWSSSSWSSSSPASSQKATIAPLISCADAERHARADQPLGDVGGQREALRRRGLEHLRPQGQRRDHAGDRGQQEQQLLHGVEDRLLVLLQVAVVGQRQALEHREQAGQVADEPAGLAAGQLGDVGVLLLRHDRRPGRPGVVEARPAELGRRPEHDLLPQPGEVDAEQRGGEAELRGEVAVADRVDRVVRGPVEAELGGDRVGVQRQRRAGERAGAEGLTAARLSQSCSRSTSRASGVRVREQLVGDEHRLGVLQVRHAGRGDVRRTRSAEPEQRELQRRRAPPRARGRGAAGTAAGRWRPGRCGCGRPAACRPARRASRSARARAPRARPRRTRRGANVAVGDLGGQLGRARRASRPARRR